MDEFDTTVNLSAIVRSYIKDGESYGEFIEMTPERTMEWYSLFEKWLRTEVKGWITIEGIKYPMV